MEFAPHSAASTHLPWGPSDEPSEPCRVDSVTNLCYIHKKWIYVLTVPQCTPASLRWVNTQLNFYRTKNTAGKLSCLTHIWVCEFLTAFFSPDVIAHIHLYAFGLLAWVSLALTALSCPRQNLQTHKLSFWSVLRYSQLGSCLPLFPTSRRYGV